MQFITLIAILAPIFAGVSAKCETNGYNGSWPKDRQPTKEVATKLCNNGQLSGSFQQNAVKYGCGEIADSSLKSGKRWVSLSVTWTGKTPTSYLGPADCVLRLQNEIGGCEHGGTTTTADWKFTAGPQNSACK